ncbi:protein of unknown function [Azospirillum lipoferum 4B]|uniref:Uncharacterized protein n=1 Tax=Azospirillum lipoferum (strain 4B) TaxID=862719 RepID=G7Z2H8_AZOL4|nr:protein of unknown function [Azospirillum lipoferum 4B]
MARSANCDPAAGVFRPLGDTPNSPMPIFLPRALWEKPGALPTRRASDGGARRMVALPRTQCPERPAPNTVS